MAPQGSFQRKEGERVREADMTVDREGKTGDVLSVSKAEDGHVIQGVVRRAREMGNGREVDCPREFPEGMQRG